jgi:hypothetical protein
MYEQNVFQQQKSATIAKATNDEAFDNLRQPWNAHWISRFLKG